MEKRALFSFDLMKLTLTEKSGSLNLGARQFQRDVDLSVKLWDGKEDFSIVGFQTEISYLLNNDIGCLNLRILNVSMKQWYVYRLWMERIS